MKGELFISIRDDQFEDKFTMFVSPSDFGLIVCLDKDETLLDALNDKKSFYECMEYAKKYRVDNYDYTDEDKQIAYLEKNFDNLIDSVEYINFTMCHDHKEEVIKNNPIVLTKKIVLPELIDINEKDKILELMEKYKDNCDNTYVSLIGNANHVSISECYKTLKTIEKQVEKIKKLGLSPMENIMYIYDLVRNRIYKLEDENESQYKSRDLIEVLSGDKIVCTGYANIFCAYLTCLGINNEIVGLEGKTEKEGHSRSVAYVKDPKYDIDGVYYFDPTWDSRKKDEDNKYLYRYIFFAKTRTYMEDIEEHSLKDERFDYYPDLAERFEDALNKNNMEKSLLYGKSVNYMAGLLGEEKIGACTYIFPFEPKYGTYTNKEMGDKVRKMVEKFNKEIPGETMLKVLNNVRNVQYLENPEWYQNTLNDYYRTYLISDWKFRQRHLDEAERLLMVIFGDEECEFEDIDERTNFINFVKEDNIHLENNDKAKVYTNKKS